MTDEKRTVTEPVQRNGSSSGDSNPVVEVVATAVGLVVEASSLLAGDPMAALERQVAEVEVEDALDGESDHE